MTRPFDIAARVALLIAAGCLALQAGCAEQHERPDLAGQDVRISILHTSDIHARLLPYRAQLGANDEKLGLLQNNEPFGGIARMAHIIQRERALGERVLFVDSGDCFQGAPIFNAFHGEVEIRTLGHLQPDAVVVGNHEFDEGLKNYAKQLQGWSTFPVLAANYLFVPGNPLSKLVKPISISNIGGVRVGFIGVANFSSLSSVTDVGNSLGIVPLDISATVQEWINVLRPQVDLIVAVSHAGLGEDEDIIQETEGLDVVMGGHLHIVLSPPKVILDKAGREVILAHSGAFAKYVGRLDLIVRDGDVINHKYRVFPVDATVPEDPLTLDLLEPYRLALNQLIDLTTVYGYAGKHIRRFDFDGGDSPLGNLVAEAIRKHAWADVGLTNSLGIRTDIFPGPITLDDLFNIFPFNNTITTLYMSGIDIQALLDYTTRRSAGRGCATQVQIAGIRFTMNCTFPSDEDECGDECPPRAENVVITSCGDPDIEDKSLCTETPLQPYQIYEVATNDYIAHGGSGFTVLKINNTQVNTQVPLRDAVLEEIVRSKPCIEDCRGADGRLRLAGCETFAGCVDALLTYKAQYCEHIDETANGKKVVPLHCGMDAGSCKTDGDCYRLDVSCGAGGACTQCASTADCTGSAECWKGFCVTPELSCIAGRCHRRCKVEAGCHASRIAPEGQVACVGADTGSGYCLPASGTLCATDNECIDSALACHGALPGCSQNADCIKKGLDSLCEHGRCVPRRKACKQSGECEGAGCVNGWCSESIQVGLCGPCQVDSHCPSGQICADGRCVAATAKCHQNRCRPLCQTDVDCPHYNSCVDGACLPLECLEPTDMETACLLDNIYSAQAECSKLPCPRAESDGRIKRLLPPNLDQLPEDINPDDPEG